MLEKLPDVVGQALRTTRAGLEALTLGRFEAPSGIVVTSPAFDAGAAMPVRFTADGAGVSPPLRWTGVPAGTRSVAVLVEDADSPTPKPLVHAIVHDLPAGDGGLEEGAMAGEGGAPVGRNSFLRSGWLPPDPPPGHGPHRYVFQVYALDLDPADAASPGRGDLVELMTGHVLATGTLVATFERPGADAAAAGRT